MRSAEEIVAAIKERGKTPRLFDFAVNVLVGYLSFDEAEPIRNVEIERSMWDADADLPRDPDAIASAVKEYLPFAIEKAHGERGLSALRSVQKIWAWLFLLGLEGEVDWDDYEPYGLPILHRIEELFAGWESAA